MRRAPSSTSRARSTSCCSTCRCPARAVSKASSSCAPAIRSCPIVVVSALEDPRIIHEVMQCGAAGFISKSTRGADLGRALEDVMSGSVVLPKGYQPPAPSGARRLRSRRAHRHADAAAGARAAHAAPGPAQQADRLRSRRRRDDGEGARLGDPAQAEGGLAHAGGDRGGEDRLRFDPRRPARATSRRPRWCRAGEKVQHQRAQLRRLHRLQQHLATAARVPRRRSPGCDRR